MGYSWGVLYARVHDARLPEETRMPADPKQAVHDHPGCADAAGCDGGPEMMPADKRDDALKRLARVNGQVSGIARMVEDGRHCTEVLQQIAAAQKAMDAVGNLVLRNYLERCVTTAIEGGDPLIYDELMKVLTRYR